MQKASIFFHLRICKGAEAATGSSSRPCRGSVWLAELLAAEFAGDVCAVAFRPDGAAVRHKFVGAARGEAPAAVGTIRRAVARDVAAMGLREVAEHERQLRALRAAVERELQARAAARAKAGATAAGDKRAPPEQQQQQAGGAGDSKIRRIIID